MRHITTLVMLLLPVPALAGQAEAETCAASLSAPAHQIYEAAAPYVTPTSDLHDVVYQQTRKLVTSGQISRQTARADAQSAGLCLQKLQS